MRVRRCALAGVVAGALVSAGFAGSAQAAYPLEPSFLAAAAVALRAPAAAPPGVNDDACRLSTAHPRPVVLIPGTFANMEDDFGALGPILANDGYCVFSLNYGAPAGRFIEATGPVLRSAATVAAVIRSVSKLYGGVKVDVVGHSQGGLIAELVAKFYGEAGIIDRLVALSPTTHGTTIDGFTALARFFPGAEAILGAACPACEDQLRGSPVVRMLDRGPIAEPGPSYTVIETRHELIVTPDGSSFIDEPGVVDEYDQSACPADATGHIELPFDNTTIRLTLNALDPSTAAPPNCSETFPFPAVQQ